MRELGQVVQVQVQRSSLKQGERPYRVYDPYPLLVVDRLALHPEGVIGHTADGGEIVDVHNAKHPETRFAEVNGISIGFTQHYELMRKQFGPHIADGSAGENILVAADRPILPDELTGRLAFMNSEGDDKVVHLQNVMVAAPCVEFSHYVWRSNLRTAPLPAETVRSTLQFLDNGVRGYYASVVPAGWASVQAGDRLVVLE